MSKKVLRAVERAIPAGLYELMGAVALAKVYEWRVELERGVASATADLDGVSWTIVHTPDSQPAPTWQVARGGASIGGADSALDAMALVLVKQREHLDAARRRVGSALADVTMRITELVDEDQAARSPEVRREPQGAARRNSETAMAPEPNSPADVGYLDPEAQHEQLMEQLTWLLNGAGLDAQTRGIVEAEIRRTNEVTRLDDLSVDALTKLTAWLAKHKAGEARALVIKQRLAGKEQR